MVQHTSKPVQKSQKHHQKECDKFYYAKEQLYLETDVLGVSLMTKVRGEMQLPKIEAPDNAAMWPIAFISKSLTNAETCYSNIHREALCISYGLEMFHH